MAHTDRKAMAMSALLLATTFVLFGQEVFGQTPSAPAPGRVVAADPIAGLLIEHGFENISVAQTGDDLRVFYENRIYRYEARALQEVIKLLGPTLTSTQRLVLTPLNRGVPLLTVAVPPGAYHALEQGDLGVAAFVEALEITLRPEPLEAEGFFESFVWTTRRARPHTFKLDLAFHPQFRASLGKFGDPFETQFNLAPVLTTSLWQGMALSAQAIIPLQNELSDEEDDLRPGLITLSQVLRPLPTTLVSGAVGYFTQSRYGLDVEVQHHLMNGRLMLGGRVGYTGYLALVDRQWFYGKLDLVTFGGSARYYVLPKHSLWLQLGYGRFLFQDHGWRVDAHRRFGEVEVNLFAFVTGSGENAGVRVVLPLFPRKHMRPTRLRVRTANTFAWAYAFDKFARSGTTYATGGGLDAFWERIEPGSLRYDLMRLDGWRAP